MGRDQTEELRVAKQTIRSLRRQLERTRKQLVKLLSQHVVEVDDMAEIPGAVMKPSKCWKCSKGDIKTIDAGPKQIEVCVACKARRTLG